MKKITVGFLGCGNVGGGAYDIIRTNKSEIAKRENVELFVKRVLVRDKGKIRNNSCPMEILTTDAEEILNDPDIQIVAEFLGGIEPARTYILAALNNGKTVVTANKAVLSNCWQELETAAVKNGVGLYFDASVAGGIPVVKTIYQSLQANRIDSLIGIINGTTNFILTKISEEGISYAEALRQAQQMGLAEADPTMDVSGMDVVHKLSILGSMAFDKHIPVESIYREGITGIEAEDMKYGEQLGLVIKLLAVGKRNGEKIEARVQPTFLSKTHPLASIRGEFNAVYLNGNAVGETMLYGKGAGALPTGSSVVSDLITAARTEKHYYNAFNDGKNEATIDEEWESCYYIRCTVADKAGVLAAIASIFCKYRISVASCIQHNSSNGCAPLVFLTHKIDNRAMKKAVGEIALLPEVTRVDSVIPIEYQE